MNVAGPELSPQAVPVTGERKERMKAVLPEMTVERHVLLFAVSGVFCRTNIYDESLLLLSLHERVIRPGKRILERPQSGLIPFRNSISNLQIGEVRH